MNSLRFSLPPLSPSPPPHRDKQQKKQLLMELAKETQKATILAVGTANPPNCFYQADYPDYYFRVTKSEHMTGLKAKFKLLCQFWPQSGEKSMIKKRYMHLTEEILKENPNGGAQLIPSLDTRLDVEIMEVPKHGAEAATKAIKEWGQRKSRITHLVFHSTLGTVMPGVDYQLIKLLGLEPSVKRFMLYHLGCYGGVTVLRLAKDLAENNPGARVLAVCSEVMINAFRGPLHSHLDILVGHAIFGDGAGAFIVGADPNTLFHIVSANQTILPESKGAVGGKLREVGLIYYFSKQLSSVVSSNIDKCLVEAFSSLGITDWESLFWIVHPGGRKMLDEIEEKLKLKEESLIASRQVLRDYGNMWSSSVIFVLAEMRKRSLAEGRTTTGEGFEWGVLLGFGPSVTVETIVLRSVPTAAAH